VVVDGDLQGLAGFDDLPGHVDVGGRWRRVCTLSDSGKAEPPV
jgi:hypothetical protein